MMSYDKVRILYIFSYYKKRPEGEPWANVVSTDPRHDTYISSRVLIYDK